MLLKGVIDCPDLPLNVSRSALQNDGFVKKISDYITKKVADKLSGMYKVERESYEKYWEDINPFIKYGCLKDDKFREKMKDFIIFKNLDDKYVTLPEYVEAAKHKTEEAEVVEEKAEEAEVTAEKTEETDDKTKEEKTTVYYVTDLQQQSQYINMFKDAGLDALILTQNIDQPFITQLEQSDDKVKFQRIDADLTESFKDEAVDEEALKKETESLSELFRKALNNDKLDVKVEKLKNANVSSMITLSEESRRMQDMMKMYNMSGMDPAMFGGQGETLVLNSNNELVQYLFNNPEADCVELICQQLYDLAMLSHKPLQADELTAFIARSNELMMKLAK